MENHNVSMDSSAAVNAPAYRLKTNRGWLKLILLSVITLGIYPIIFYSGISDDVNLVCGRYDGKKTMHYCLLLFVVGPLTLGIGSLVWYHRICNRIGMELARRGLAYRFGAGTFWGWCLLGSLIIVGPVVFTAKLCNAMNLLCADYNVKG